MNKIFYIFRHGQTDYNAEKRVQSILDIPLNQDSVNQAKQLAKNLSDVQFDCIYSSPLSRALDTAKIVVENRDIEIITDPGLQERNLGALCGKIVKTTDAPVNTQFDINTDMINIPLALLSDDNYAPPKNGESYNMFAKRVLDTMLNIAKNTDAKTVGVSTHGGVMSFLIRHFTNFSHGGTPNTGYIKMQWDGKTFTLLETPDWLLKINALTQSGRQIIYLSLHQSLAQSPIIRFANCTYSTRLLKPAPITNYCIKMVNTVSCGAFKHTRNKRIFYDTNGQVF